MTEEERRKIFISFISNGMDISPFLFVSEVDKKHFFGMYEEYLTSMSELGTEVVYDKYGDITVLMRDKIVCTFYISDDYKTLRIDTGLPIDDKDLEICMTLMFLTIKELGSMIKALTKTFDSMSKAENTSSSMTDRNFIPIASLPKDIKNTINKISKLQKSILAENRKYKAKRIKKDKEDK